MIKNENEITSRNAKRDFIIILIGIILGIIIPIIISYVENISDEENNIKLINTLNNNGNLNNQVEQLKETVHTPAISGQLADLHPDT